MTPDELKQKHAVDRAWLDQLALSAQARRFFGTLSITFHDGLMKGVDKSEHLLPPTPPPPAR